jgi:hypothetical protein
VWAYQGTTEQPGSRGPFQREPWPCFTFTCR